MRKMKKIINLKLINKKGENKMKSVQFNKVLLITALLVSLLLISCAANKPFSGTPETGLTFRYTLDKNVPHHYSSTSTSTQNMEMMGRSMETSSNSSIYFTFTGKEKDESNNLLFDITVDSMSSVANSMMGEQNIDFSSVIGKSFTLILSPFGEEIDYLNIDSLQIDLGPMAGGKMSIKQYFRDQFPDLPEKSIKIGDKWTKSNTDTSQRMGMDIISKTESNNTFEGIENINGFECLKISTDSEGTIDGAGEQGGNEIVFEGYLEVSSTSYFAYKIGRFLSLESNVFMEGTVVISGANNMTMPMTTESKIKVILVD